MCASSFPRFHKLPFHTHTPHPHTLSLIHSPSVCFISCHSNIFEQYIMWRLAVVPLLLPAAVAADYVLNFQTDVPDVSDGLIQIAVDESLAPLVPLHLLTVA